MENKVILCVDDEEIILNSLESQLRLEFGDEYFFEFAQDAETALEILEEVDPDVLVIISDFIMPGTKGDEFLIKAHAKYPNIIKVMLTGQADESAVKNAKDNANLHRCLYKPWNCNELFDTIRTGLASI